MVSSRSVEFGFFFTLKLRICSTNILFLFYSKDGILNIINAERGMKLTMFSLVDPKTTLKNVGKAG
jgi:hypothetical protein